MYKMTYTCLNIFSYIQNKYAQTNEYTYYAEYETLYVCL